VCIGEYYCSQERDVLIEETQEKAEQYGHTLGTFDTKAKGEATWEAHCINCGQLAGIRLNPQPDAPAMYGEAVSTPCPQAEAEPTRDKPKGDQLSWLAAGNV
jgi:hypothetical protein